MAGRDYKAYLIGREVRGIEHPDSDLTKEMNYDLSEITKKIQQKKEELKSDNPLLFQHGRGEIYLWEESVKIVRQNVGIYTS